MRNITWQTEFQGEVPYKTGDIVEYTRVFTSNKARHIKLDISSLQKGIDITKIEVNDKELPLGDTIVFDLIDVSLVKIT